MEKGQQKNRFGYVRLQMITRIREVRRARGMTLDDVAQACKPPTTPQTIGRLETGTRTVSIGWLNRIAEALGVEAADLVDGGGGDKAELPVIAVLGVHGASAPRRTAVVVAPRPKPGQVAITVLASNGDYRAGDEIWCDMVEPDGFGAALNRDVLVPRPAGRFLFGRLIDRDGERLQLLPPGAGGRQQIVANPPWIAVATRLVRGL
jgi:transcriptional regulator with XRE-family HTH domain